MNITKAFIQRLTEMKDDQCSKFLKLNQADIDFELLIKKTKEMIASAVDASDRELETKLHDVIGDATLFAAVQHQPPAAVLSTENL